MILALVQQRRATATIPNNIPPTWKTSSTITMEQTIPISTGVAWREEAALCGQSHLVIQPLQSRNTNPAPLPGENTWHEELALHDQSYLNIQPPYSSAQGTSSIPHFRPQPTHTLECALRSDTIGVPELWPARPEMVPSLLREEYRSEGEIPVSQFSTLAGALDEE